MVRLKPPIDIADANAKASAQSNYLPGFPLRQRKPMVVEGMLQPFCTNWPVAGTATP